MGANGETYLLNVFSFIVYVMWKMFFLYYVAMMFLEKKYHVDCDIIKHSKYSTDISSV